MRNDSQRNGDGGALMPISGRASNGIIPSSFKTLLSYLRMVSSGASTVASTVRSAASAASAVVERERDGETNRYQVSWAGFDRLELERGMTRQVLLLGFSNGFQVWDVEVADNVHNLVSRHDGPVSFIQTLPKPLASIQSEVKFAESRPLLIICADGSFSGDINLQEGSAIPSSGPIKQFNGSVNGGYMPTTVWFYSLTSQSYVHLLRFRSTVHLVRCSSRVIAVLQSAQIHCLNVATLEREYTILINPVTTGSFGFTNIGVGPLAVGPRWMAYSGSQVAIANSRCVSPQHLTPSSSFPAHTSNGSLVAHYARESSKHLAAGIVTLGDMGYKRLSRYYSELLPEGNCQPGTVRVKMNNGHAADSDNVGMVIVRDMVDKTVIAQFRAHKSPIQSLCFDPSGTLLVTASILGHNINVFRIMIGSSGPSHVHLYRLQRGVTNAVIQDISFSSDSRCIMISSSRGTSHLFAISPSGGPVSSQSTEKNNVSSLRTKPAANGLSPSSGLQVLTEQTICWSGPPVTLSAISRIRSGSSNGWMNTVSGAAAAASGWLSSSLSGAVASVFHEGRNNVNTRGADSNILKKNYYLLVFSPSGSVTQYALRYLSDFDDLAALPVVSTNREPELDYDDARLMVEALQKWNVCRKQKQNRKEQGDNMDSYGVNSNSDTSKIYPENLKCSNNALADVLGTTAIEKKMATEEKHHMYVSEAELQMHQNQNPLWSRHEICFHSMMDDGSSIIDQGTCGGEVEIESIPTRMIEGRSKGLVPVSNYLQSPKFQQGRSQFQPQGSDVSDSGSLDSFDNGAISENEMGAGVDEERQNRWFSETSRSFVDTNDNTSPILTTDPETVNTRENFTRESEQLRFVVNSSDGLNMDNHFAGDDEFD